MGAVCSSWRALAKVLLFDQPWQQFPGLICFPEQLLALAPQNGSPSVFLHCDIFPRPGGRFDLWMDVSLQCRYASMTYTYSTGGLQSCFLLSARKTGFNSYSISLQRRDHVQATARNIFRSAVKRIANKSTEAADRSSELEVARLLGNPLRTSYKLLAVDKPWIRRALGITLVGGCSAPSPYGTEAPYGGSSNSSARGSPSASRPTLISDQPLLMASYTIRRNGFLIPRR